MSEGQPEKKKRSHTKAGESPREEVKPEPEPPAEESKKPRRKKTAVTEDAPPPEPVKEAESGVEEGSKKKHRKKDDEPPKAEDPPRAEEPKEEAPPEKKHRSKKSTDNADPAESSDASEPPAAPDKKKHKKKEEEAVPTEETPQSGEVGAPDAKDESAPIAADVSVEVDGALDSKKKKKAKKAKDSEGTVVKEGDCPFTWGEIESDLSTSFSSADKPSHSLSIDQEKLDAEAQVHHHAVIEKEEFPKPTVKGEFKATFTLDKWKIEVHRLKREVPHKVIKPFTEEGTASITWSKAKKSTVVALVVSRKGKTAKIVKKLRDLQLDGPQTEEWEFDGGKVSASYEFTPAK